MGARRTPAEDGQADEQRECWYADRCLDRRRASLVPFGWEPHGAARAVGEVSRSTGTVALWVILTFQPGITFRLNPVTVTVAVVVVRRAVAEVAGRASSPPASAMKSFAAWTPSACAPVRRRRLGRLPARPRWPASGRGRTARPASPGT